MQGCLTFQEKYQCSPLNNSRSASAHTLPQNTTRVEADEEAVEAAPAVETDQSLTGRWQRFRANLPALPGMSAITQITDRLPSLQQVGEGALNVGVQAGLLMFFGAYVYANQSPPTASPVEDEEKSADSETKKIRPSILEID